MIEMEVVSNKLCLIEKVFNPWRVKVKDIATKKHYTVHLREGYQLDSSLVGDSIYFCGIVKHLTITNATCYSRDHLGCIDFIKTKGKAI